MTQSWHLVAFGMVAYVAAVYLQRRRRKREAAGLIPHVEITVRVPSSLYRLAQDSVVVALVATLTGVSITLCPVFLFLFGRDYGWLDWRVIACFAATYFVPMFYMLVAGPTLRHARENRGIA